MGSIPVFLTAEKQHILIIGASSAAMTKVALLSDSGARLTVIGCGAPQALQTAGLQAKVTAVLDRDFQPADIDGKTLVYMDGVSRETEATVRALAAERGLPINLIDQPAKSSFTTPAQLRRGPIEVAFSSGGLAPVFVRLLRK